MHPALSIIFFTTAAGAGYGLLLLVGLAGPLGLLPATRWLGFVLMGLSLGLIAGGLLSSTFHLGHPERAWRALSQWRSSWLSREGVLALATFLPAGLYAIGWVFLQSVTGLWALFGLLAAAGAVATVYATAMIYASLKTIRQWHHPLTLPVYLLLGLTSGALFLNAVVYLFDVDYLWNDLLVILLLPVAWGLKVRYWRRIDSEPSVSTPESATGLGDWGKVRLLDPPHTEENYLMREMGFQVARKHSMKLRRQALIFGLTLPFVLAIIALLTSGWLAIVAAVLAAASGALGVVIERWLFFAEAKHTVMLYYGRDTA